MKFNVLLLSLLTAYQVQAQSAKIKLEKVVFHTGACFGSCPVLDAEVSCNRNVKFVAQTVFKAGSRSERDSSKMGSFTGKLSKAEFKMLERIVQDLNPDTLNVKEVTCCDAPVRTLIIYYNKGKRKYIHSMILPEELTPLIAYMEKLPEHATLKKSKQAIVIGDK